MKQNPTSRPQCVATFDGRGVQNVVPNRFDDVLRPDDSFLSILPSCPLARDSARPRPPSFVRSYQEYKSSLPEIFRLNLRQLQLSARKANN